MATIKLKAGDTIEVEFDAAEEIFEIHCGEEDQVSIYQTAGWEIDPQSDDPHQFEERKIY